MKKFISFSFSIAFFAILFVSCNPSSSCKSDTCAKVISEQSVRDVDAVLTHAAQLQGKQVEIEGVCTHICKHGGRKIFLMGSDDTRTIRVEAGEVRQFDQKCVNSIVRVKGILHEERIDEAYLQQWETSLAQQTEKKHGESEAGCSTEKKARGETANSSKDRIRQFRQRIAEQKEKNGKDYLSFYHITASGYTIQE
ncbi:MAG: hypothetical protein RR346_06295 [Bacteroidales bacterium]